MNDQRLRELLYKYKCGTATEEERALLESWYLYHKEKDLPDYPKDERLLDAASVRESLEFQLTPHRIIKLPVRISIAACILVLLTFGVYFTFRKSAGKTGMAAVVHDIPPGQNKALLTLANGHKIYLAGLKKGVIYHQGPLQISCKPNGVIAYTVAENRVPQSNGSNRSSSGYSTLSTPRGGQLSIVLSDGTVAYLDAQSSINFPLIFKGTERRVTVTGQVYFEVKHNAAVPFKVDVNDQTIEDIGTSFNVNAYDDEPAVKTTLINGSVKIKHGVSAAVLKPGQEAVTASGKAGIKVKSADLEEVTSWKNGYFLFNNEKLESIMRKIERWYNVDVVYPANQYPDVEYWGSITRYDNVSKVLNMLQITGGVKFRIEGRKIIIEKK